MEVLGKGEFFESKGLPKVKYATYWG